METSNKYIIGGGITGLIWAFYHPEFTVITPEIGGQFGKTSMMWLHDTAETRQLLKDLGWKHPEQLAKHSYMGYYNAGWISNNQTTEHNLIMIQKKMSDWNEPINTEFIPKTRDMSLSNVGGLNYMHTLDVDLNEVLERIQKKTKIIQGKVDIIYHDRKEIVIKTMDGTDTLHYDELISTIPAPLFWQKWTGLNCKKFKSSPITIIITKSKPKFYDDKYEMVYYDDTVPFTRVSKFDNVYSIEFTGLISKDQFTELYPEIEIESIHVINEGRIFEDAENLSPSKDITFTGRFGKWKYSITIEWVILQALNYKK